jgi:gluconokinase
MSTSDVIVVMGVSASGKTTVGRAISRETSWDFVEGDSFLSAAQRKSLRAGRLSDTAYDTWLHAIGAWIDDYERTGRSAVVACSSLRRQDRDVLREGRPHVRFCHVTAGDDVLHQRAGDRAGPLDTELSALHPLDPDEHGVTVSTEGADDDDVARRALASLGLDPGHS